jgi:hypothetical protein
LKCGIRIVIRWDTAFALSSQVGLKAIEAATKWETPLGTTGDLERNLLRKKWENLDGA